MLSHVDGAQGAGPQAYLVSASGGSLIRDLGVAADHDKIRQADGLGLVQQMMCCGQGPRRSGRKLPTSLAGGL